MSLFSREVYLFILIVCMIFLSPFLDDTRMSMSTVSFLAQLELAGTYCRFFPKRFPVCRNLFVLLFLVTSFLVVSVQPCIEWIPIKNFFLRQLTLQICWSMSPAFILNYLNLKTFLENIKDYLINKLVETSCLNNNGAITVVI